MTPERWQRVKKIFRTVLEHPPGERSALLAAACVGDAALRREVEALLAADEGGTDAVAGAVAGVAAQLLAADRGEAPHGRRVGPYEILGEISHGGMGTVHLARRADGQYRQRVAIKWVRLGPGTVDPRLLVARFHKERQILASLNHPHIARLLDGGSTAEDLPYLVMEYIEGVPIDAYCATHHLRLRQRLELFRQVCLAVHYAHQKLVVHRDLKPDNILVTAEGEPKLLDFGIAKLLEPEDFSEPAVLTAPGAQLMTLEYASPEQVRGGMIGTASDIYSLGVVLYELLTGRSPYRFKDRQRQEMERVIHEQEPLKPSATLDLPPVPASERRGIPPAKLSRQLAGDLDPIVLQALRKEPERRYGTAERLADDLRRALDGLPVSARRGTLSYRAGKFARRHRAALAAAVLVLLSLIAGIATTAWQAVVADRQRARAEQARVEAEQVADFLVDLFQVSDPFAADADPPTVRQLLDRGTQRISGVLRDQPEVRARLLVTLGEVHLNLGFFDSAGPLFEEALRIREQLFGEACLEVADSLDKLAEVRYLEGDIETAEALFRRALRLRLRLLGEVHPKVAQSLNNVGGILSLQHRYEEAELLTRRALEMRRRLGNHPEEMGESLHDLAVVLRDKGEYDEAEALFREALVVAHELLGEEHAYIGRILGNLGELHFRRGEYSQAEAVLQRTLALQRKVFPPGHLEIGMSEIRLGKILCQQGASARGAELLRQGLATFERHLPPEHSWLASARSTLGAC